MNDKDSRVIVVSSQATANNYGCLHGCGAYILYIFLLGIALVIIKAIAPFVGSLLGFCLGLYGGSHFAAVLDGADRSFRQSLGIVFAKAADNNVHARKSALLAGASMAVFAIIFSVIGYKIGLVVSEALP